MASLIRITNSYFSRLDRALRRSMSATCSIGPAERGHCCKVSMRTKSRRTKRPTQADVARLANVSQTTVSLVLNNDQIASVPPETRQRIREAMEALGYVP